MDKDTVLVLGAGFTHALSDEAPLLHWDLRDFARDLKEKYRNFPPVLKILRSLKIDGKINIETLLSRLYSGMPYDGAYLPDGDRNVLYDDIYNHFLNVLRKIEIDSGKTAILAKFAKYVIEKEITCITFNYDTVLDQALWEYKRSNAIIPEKYWHPDGGYGFFCRPAESLTSDQSISKDVTSTLLLKVHGSLNWKIKKGFQKPYPLDALIHEERWRGAMTITEEDISNHLEPFPFVVPPILDKSVLTEQPILRVVWENAYRKLQDAKKVVFLGYSLPKTDIAASFLFGETLSKKWKTISVVNVRGREKQKKNNYRELFHNMKDFQFSFVGITKWVERECNV